MKPVSTFRRPRQAQVLVFLVTALVAIILLAGLAIDSGLLYLAKARLSRAVDGAALAAVGNFHQSDDPTTNQAAVAYIMRNFAVLNFTGLNGVSLFPVITTGTYTLPTGQTGTTYTYNFNDGTHDGGATGPYRKYVEAVLYTGSGGDVTSATCNARCPVQTYFMGVSGTFKDLKVSSAAVATRKPRLIMVVVDRSASMLANGASAFGQDDPTVDPPGGAYGLPQAIATFLNFFDTSSDSIGIVSFSSNARLEMPLTTNFLNAGTNVLYDAYQYDSNEESGIPGVDPEQTANTATYAASGVRRMKFGGTTAADEGLRMGMEEMMADPGFNNPDVIKYLVLFTDGAWNNCRTLLAAPGYVNTVTIPAVSPIYVYEGTTNLLVPALKPQSDLTNGMSVPGSGSSIFTSLYHTTEWWQSADGVNEPLTISPSPIIGGSTTSFSTNGCISKVGTVNYIATNLTIWLQPGAVDYVYRSTAPTVPALTYVSDYTHPTNQVTVSLGSGDKNVLVVPGYIADGCFFDGLDLPENDNSDQTGGINLTYPRYKANNYLEPFMWPDTNSASVAYPATGDTTGASTSTMRQLMYRNYANLLTGFYIFRADDPLGTTVEPLTGANRPYYGLGPYYPSSGFYWPFDLVGVDQFFTYSLIDPTHDPDLTSAGLARHGSYSINMQSTNAAPNWTGELFYEGHSGGLSGTTSASDLMNSASDWQVGLPSFASVFSAAMVTDPVHNTNLAVAVWRPSTYNGTTTVSLAGVTPSGSTTGGYVADGPQGAATTHYYANSMAYSGRPTHYFDFSTSTWVAITNNHVANLAALPLGNWKAQEYAWHARASGVTIFTVGYGGEVGQAQQALLAVIANSTNTTAGGGSNMPYNAGQPIGQQFYATNGTQISNDFYSVGQAINASLTQ